jgi:hypothetical protein
MIDKDGLRELAVNGIRPAMTPKMSLLDRAKAISTSKSPSKKPTKEELDLLLAYLRTEITGTQVATVLGFSSKNHSAQLGYWVLKNTRNAIEYNMIKLEVV